MGEAGLAADRVRVGVTVQAQDGGGEAGRIVGHISPQRLRQVEAFGGDRGADAGRARRQGVQNLALDPRAISERRHGEANPFEYFGEIVDHAGGHAALAAQADDFLRHVGPTSRHSTLGSLLRTSGMISSISQRAASRFGSCP